MYDRKLVGVASRVEARRIISCGIYRPLIAALAGEALEMVDVVSCLHDHLEGRNQFRAGRAVTGRAEQPAYVYVHPPTHE